MLVKKKNSIYYTVMFFMLVIVGVGYAYFNSTISINGSTALAKNTWDVHFENAIVTDGSVESESSIEVDSSSTVVKFSTRLDLPGDFYEFTIDVVNDGTIDAMLDEVVKSELSEVQAEYLTYNVSYVDGSEIKRSDKLAAGNKETIIVRVEYIEDTTSTVVEENDQYLELSLSLLYTQYGKTVYSKNSLIGRMANEAVLDNIASEYVTSLAGINFSSPSSDTNGKGVYIRSGTENDRNPIYYYRGDVDNNNVVFANYCWKMVRTTETGGVKLIYNGIPRYSPLKYDEYMNVENNSLAPFRYDDSEQMWTSTNEYFNSEISFSVKEEGIYYLTSVYENYNMFSYATIYIDDIVYGEMNSEDVSASSNEPVTIHLGNLSSSNEVRIVYSNDWMDSNTISFSLSRKSENIICNNVGKGTQLENESEFNSSNYSPSYVGYMYGEVYNSTSMQTSDIKAGTKFGNNVVYNNGTYTLIDIYTAESDWSSTVQTEVYGRYHYTCFSNNDSCSTVYYIFDGGTGKMQYMTLTNGKNVNDLLDEMLINSTNENNSTLKTVIDDWYKENLIQYTNKIEDTVWCNDRGISELNGWDNKNDTGEFKFSTYKRATQSGVSMNCDNPNDRFTVSSKNGNGKLTYPVALLTSDEVVTAGAVYGSIAAYNTNIYLYTGHSWFTMSPHGYNYDGAYMFIFETGGSLWINWTRSSTGIRPSISLKAGTEYVRGDGTTENPYIVE